MKQTSIALSLALLLAGCTQSSVPVAPKPVVQKVAPKPVVKKPVVKKPVVVKKQLPPPPKKDIKLREVDDTNFNPDYMYPEDKKAAPKTVEKAPTPIEPAAATGGMSKEECIGMITQEKFDKYTAMFGSEEASIKRCNMLKAMQ